MHENFYPVYQYVVYDILYFSKLSNYFFQSPVSFLDSGIGDDLTDMEKVVAGFSSEVCSINLSQMMGE